MGARHESELHCTWKATVRHRGEPQVAVAALGALEAVPPHRVERMLADGALGARIMACLSSSSREVPYPC